jgi:hypothetical protein
MEHSSRDGPKNSPTSFLCLQLPVAAYLFKSCPMNIDGHRQFLHQAETRVSQLKVSL